VLAVPLFLAAILLPPTLFNNGSLRPGLILIVLINFGWRLTGEFAVINIAVFHHNHGSLVCYLPLMVPLIAFNLFNNLPVRLSKYQLFVNSQQLDRDENGVAFISEYRYNSNINK